MAPEGAVGEKVVTDVTVVVTDEDDQLPVFNKNQFLVFIPEDIGEFVSWCGEGTRPPTPSGGKPSDTGESGSEV